ncbi:MAG: hypothetical protein U9M92_00765 [Patescibacteria group bacterium]|nr:hypothetical protein [Patescibacteria group bacterium]
MLPSNFFRAKVSDKGVILLRPYFTGSSIRFLGTSIPTSAKPGDNELASICIYPEESRPGLVAVVVMVPGKRRDTNFRQFFLQVRWENGQPRIDLEETSCLLDSRRLGQAYDDHIEVEIDGQRYSSVSVRATRAGKPILHVPDANLLCCYLAGTAGAEEIVEAAEEQEAEVSVREELAGVKAELANRTEEWAATQAAYSRFREELGPVKSAVLSLCRSVAQQWWQSRATKAALQVCLNFARTT